MELRFDLHVHTDASPDGINTALEMAEAAKARGLDGLAITDHDVALDSKTAISLSERTGVIVIPGIEVSTSEGHLVVLLPLHAMKAGTTLHEAIRIAIEEGSIPYIPHPTDPLSHGVGEQAVLSLPYRLPLESLNASTLSRYNRRADRLADRLSLPKLASSDAHHSKAVGDAYTVVDAREPSLAGVVEALRLGKTSPRGVRTPLGTSLVCYWGKILRRVNPVKN